jgi:pSer/pThr/pTyr-binding forkhead associated (FHA) protein
MTYTVDDTGEMQPIDIDEVLERGAAALVIRTGGGRAGESFPLSEDRISIGRSPDAGVFLDDVTVSRNHAVLLERGGRFSVEDQGSLNGTFVNRKRIESAELENGDELQIGKYRLTFIER